MLKYCMIALGGGLGSLARYWISTAIADRVNSGFYFGTFVVNITACLLLGFSLTVLEKRTAVNPALLYLFPIGFVGAYSTFSTFEWETFQALHMGEVALAATYAATSLLVGLGALWVGVLLARTVG